MKSILGQRPPRIASTLPPLPLDAPARSVGVLGDLRAADRALGMHVQTAPKPRPNQEALAWRSFGALVSVVAVYNHVADEIETLLAELAELRQLQQRYAVPARKNARHRSEAVRQQAAVWARKAQRFGQLADRAERVWLNADNVASIKAGIDIEVEV